MADITDIPLADIGEPVDLFVAQGGTDSVKRLPAPPAVSYPAASEGDVRGLTNAEVTVTPASLYPALAPLQAQARNFWGSVRNYTTTTRAHASLAQTAIGTILPLITGDVRTADLGTRQIGVFYANATNTPAIASDTLEVGIVMVGDKASAAATGTRFAVTYFTNAGFTLWRVGTASAWERVPAGDRQIIESVDAIELGHGWSPVRTGGNYLTTFGTFSRMVVRFADYEWEAITLSRDGTNYTYGNGFRDWRAPAAEFTGEQTRDALVALEGENRLPASAVKGLADTNGNPITPGANTVGEAAIQDDALRNRHAPARTFTADKFSATGSRDGQVLTATTNASNVREVQWRDLPATVATLIQNDTLDLGEKGLANSLSTRLFPANCIPEGANVDKSVLVRKLKAPTTAVAGQVLLVGANQEITPGSVPLPQWVKILDYTIASNTLQSYPSLTGSHEWGDFQEFAFSIHGTNYDKDSLVTIPALLYTAGVGVDLFVGGTNRLQIVRQGASALALQLASAATPRVQIHAR